MNSKLRQKCIIYFKNRNRGINIYVVHLVCDECLMFMLENLSVFVAFLWVKQLIAGWLWWIGFCCWEMLVMMRNVLSRPRCFNLLIYTTTLWTHPKKVQGLVISLLVFQVLYGRFPYVLSFEKKILPPLLSYQYVVVLVLNKYSPQTIVF